MSFTDRFAQLALDRVHREYPTKIAHALNSPEDAKTPRELTPVSFGCYDWHSAVHAHGLLVRLSRMYPDGPFVAKSRAALAESFQTRRVTTELGDPRRDGLAAARTHRQAGLEAVTGEHYEGGHWLGSFAAYLVTRRGVSK